MLSSQEAVGDQLLDMRRINFQLKLYFLGHGRALPQIPLLLK
jgi:hypothetical protein